ncbi:MAG: glutamine synthetase family protein [Defluviitaleaceae bacterium]|nr:glutamine synthetase family protein [Defluviitaleaceae bacterium]
MENTISEVLKFTKENDIKFIRLGFCDLFGTLKNISIMAENLADAFEEGVSFDAHAIHGFRDVSKSDLLLFPDPATLTVLPWRPGPGRVARFFCSIMTPEGEPFALDCRNILKGIVDKYAKMGLMAMIGAECEFYLFKTDEDGNPTPTPFDKGGYLDTYPLDKSEDIRREICLTIEEMGIIPETSHHEQGPGQNEVDFKFSDALSSADNFVTFKSVVSRIAARNGLYASFDPKPIKDAPGSGLHVNISLSQKGQNLFSREHSVIADSFMAGILAYTPEITLFLNPLSSSYERFGKFEAPKYVSWGKQNRSGLVRIPAAKGDKMRMELRSPDPSINPYLAFALILGAGLWGIENAMTLPAAINTDLYKVPSDGLTPLPESLTQAINLASSSKLVRDIIGEELHQKYIAIKEDEAANV